MLGQIENHLAGLPKGANFAGGTNYTSADFMMIFALEFSLQQRPAVVGPVTKAWIEKVQKSYVFLSEYPYALLTSNCLARHIKRCVVSPLRKFVPPCS